MAVSRRKLAEYVAGQVLAGNTAVVIPQLAAYLLQTGREREADLVVRDIEAELARQGTVIATVTTAHPLTTELQQAIMRLLGGQKAYLHQVVDPSVIGGVRIDSPGHTYDATVRRKLELLKELTIH